MTEKTIVMVLGMHRSGTSAITKGLETLGVSLSENVLPESEANKKGYWEDLEVLSINEKLLHYAGLEWYSPSPFPIDKLAEPFCLDLIDKATSLLNRKLSEHLLWGFKEPRSSRLLPFWLAVFKRAEIKPKFILAIRNPLDVAFSLEKRDKFSRLHSFHLWLLHVIPNLEALTEFDSAIVDFSSLLAEPEKTMNYIAERLNLPVNEKLLSQFSENHLDSSLCHSSSNLSDLITSKDSNDLLLKAYTALLNASLNIDEVKGLNTKNNFAELVTEFEMSQSDILSDLLLPIHESYWEKLDLYEKYWKLLHEKNLLGIHCNKLESDHLNRVNTLESDHLNRVNTLEIALNSSGDKLNLLYQSTSWKLTKPLRWITRCIRGEWGTAIAPFYNIKIIRKIKILNDISQRHGGFSINATKAFRKIKRTGLSSLIKQIKERLVQQNDILEVIQATGGNIAFDELTKKYSLTEKKVTYTYLPLRKPPYFKDKINEIDDLKFSIVMPVYNTPLDMLEKAIDSVQSQWYENWELILIDDASPDEKVREALETISDERISVLYSKSNGGISTATNIGLHEANGDYVVFMDHDDELTTDCLYELACCINEENSDFIYSDEDKIDEQGRFTQPHFKPDWSPETMMSLMYVCHVTCVRRSLIEKVGELNSDFNGAQDWDYILRVSEQAKIISHIPKVLYHWRILPESIASNIEAKPYAIEASKKVREAAIQRRGLNAEVEPLPHVPGFFRVNYLPEGNELISIIIPSRDNIDVLKRCIDSILEKTTLKNFEIILVDNGSEKSVSLNYYKEISNYSQCEVIRHDYPFNFSELCNVGANHSKGDYLLFLNDDTEVLTPDWLERLLGYARLKHIGAVGAKLLYPNQTIQHSGLTSIYAGPAHALMGVDKNEPGYFLRNSIEYNWLAVTGACLMIEKNKFDAIGQFDESFPIAYNDVELCYRLHDREFYNVVIPAVELIHYESISRGNDDQCKEKQLRLKKELGRLNAKYSHLQKGHDPYFNPNFHPNGTKFEIAQEM
ncbi:glycosyltransferase [Moritella dasanensis]|uniref:glycosyltransferase n=1 Tax=Moritella dasanensis TaxID=428031 RepID=UPI00030BA935|nr:glycosyltransferase [Moritella dasanensis]